MVVADATCGVKESPSHQQPQHRLGRDGGAIRIIWNNVRGTLHPLKPIEADCVGNVTVIGSDNGLSPGRRQAIIWTNAGILLIGSL